MLSNLDDMDPIDESQSHLLVSHKKPTATMLWLIRCGPWRRYATTQPRAQSHTLSFSIYQDKDRGQISRLSSTIDSLGQFNPGHDNALLPQGRAHHPPTTQFTELGRYVPRASHEHCEIGSRPQVRQFLGQWLRQLQLFTYTVL